MLINRRVTRTILNTTEQTSKTQSVTGSPLSFVMLASDKFYLGFQGPFASRHFQFATPNVNSTVLTVKTFNGTSFVVVNDLIDGTSGFTQDGFVSWDNNGTWAASKQTPVDDTNLFWAEFTISADLSGSTSLQSVVNLFSDDDLLRAYYPELITDSQYLPSGRTDFLEQHVAAKELVLLKMMQRQLIVDESQVIDPNEVAVASVHAVAFIVLNAIASSEESQMFRDAAFKAFDDEINELRKSVDHDGDGLVSEAEREDIVQGFVTRR